MRFSSIRIRGFGPFTDASVDFEAIPGTIVAVTGANGAGKSTLLELLAGSLYRETPTRGRLSALATGRDSLLETTVVNGVTHTLRHLVDNVSEKGESVVLDADGNAVTASAKLTEFKAWAQEHLPAPELLYSSIFAAQGSGGFLELKAGDRKAVLLRALGVERYEAMAEKARENARAAKSALVVAATRLEDERARGGSLEAHETAIKDSEQTLERARQELADAEVHAKAVRAEAEQVRAEIAAAQVVAEQRTDLDSRIVKARAVVTDRDERIRNNMQLVGRTKEIRAAAARIVELEDEIAAAEILVDRARQGTDQARADLHNAEATAQSEELLQREARAAFARAESALRDAAAVDAAAQQLPAADEAATAATKASFDAGEALDLLREQRMVGADQRIALLRDGLENVGEASTLPAALAIAAEALSIDDRGVESAATYPQRLAAAQQAATEAREAAAKAEQNARSLRQLAARTAEIEEARGARASAETAQARHGEQLELRRAGVQKAQEAAKIAEAAATAAGAKLSALRAERERIKPDADRLPKLDAAEQRIRDLNEERTASAKEVREMEEKLATLPAPTTRTVPDTDRAERAVNIARDAATQFEVGIRVARERAEAIRSAQGKVAELETARAAAEEELSEWLRLADDLGRDGLQALEIDAAGPELTALVNDLLHTCVGARWTVTIETQRNSSDGKKVIEGCEVRVLDTVAGREGPVETFSGGERVLIGEAVSLALSMLACRRSGVQGATLVRDESGAALDPTKAAAYVGMLRRAAQMCGFSRVLFVSHDAATWELADSRIHVDNGKVTVQ